MASKPESTFSKSVHRHLPPGLYFEKMHNPFRGGTFDFWYSGPRDLWVEYKFIVLPKKPETVILPNLSPLQKSWADERLHEGRDVVVIVGCKEGGVVYTGRSWLTPMSAADFRKKLVTRNALAEWLTSRMGCSL